MAGSEKKLRQKPAVSTGRLFRVLKGQADNSCHGQTLIDGLLGRRQCVSLNTASGNICQDASPEEAGCTEKLPEKRLSV